MRNEMTPTADELMARIEGLVAQMESLSADNESLAQENTRLCEDVRQTKQDCDAQVTFYKGEMDKLIEQIKLMNTRFWGFKSEKVDPLQLGLFNDVEASADDTAEPALEDVVVKPRRRGGRRKLDFEAMETVVVEHELAADELACPKCGLKMEDMSVEVTRTVKLVPAHLVVVEHRRHVYICRACSEENALDGAVPASIVRASMPILPIPGSFASPSLLAYVINAKYTNALPLYRLEEDFKCLGADISRQNMANWILNVHERWLSLLHARMKERLLSHDIVHCDETSVQVLKEPGREAKAKSYMWLFRTAAVDVPICIYEYHPTRAGKVAARFFEDWTGTITTDGYDPYFNLGPNITNTACLVHLRRKFAEIVKTAGGDAKAASVASVALAARSKVDKLFAIDAKFDSMEPNERKQARLEELALPMAEFHSWAQTQIALAVPKMALHKALAYTLKYWPYIENVLADGRLELSNNIAERSVKPFVIGRKNWLFSDTPRGAHASAAIYSIMITAKLNGLNPRAYLEWVLTEMPNADLSDPEILDSFLPFSDIVPAACRLGKKEAAKAACMVNEPIMDIDAESFDDD